jgi:tetratricopeptide (TPR) repeat protein
MRTSPRHGRISGAATASSASTSSPLPTATCAPKKRSKKALSLNPRLSVAHKFYANLEADTGRAADAIVRLLREAGRHGNDPELFAGLVHACRYGGLFEESLAAHAEARRLDPTITTSFLQTLLVQRDVDRLLAVDPRERVPGGDDGIAVIALGFAGRHGEARELLADMSQRTSLALFQQWTAHLRAWLEGRVDDMVSTLAAMQPMKIFDDPEAIFQEGWFFCDVGDHRRGLEYMQRGVARGYFPTATLAGASQFDPLRNTAEFQKLVAEAEAGRQRALAAFREAGGEVLLAH